MIKLKNILSEADGKQRFKFVRQTPGAPELVKLAQEQDPPGAAFIIKSTIELGEYTDQQILDKVIQNLKNDEMFGETSRWADGRFLYLFGPDLKDAQRKTRFNVMVLPIDYVFNSIAGDITNIDASGTDIESSTGLDIWEPEKLRAVIDDNLQAKYYIGSAPVYFQQDIDALAPKIKPFMTAVVAKKYQDQVMQLSAELESLKQSAVKDQQVLDSDKTAETDKTTDDTAAKIKPEEVMARLKEAPIKLDTTSDDVKYIQDLIYRIGMASPKLAEKNDVASWAAFRDAKPQYGTYGTRTKNFIDAIKTVKGLSTTNDDITAEVLQVILDSGKNVGITESKNICYVDNVIYEQFDIPADIDKTVTSKASKSSTTTNKTTKTNTSTTSTSTFNPIGTDYKKLNYTTPIKYGDKGQEVKLMQIFINGILGAMGKVSEEIPTNGVFDSKTLKAHKLITLYSYTLKDWRTAFLSYEKNAVKLASVMEQAESLKMQEIWQDMYNVFTGNPKKYFKKYRGWFNDDEAGAAKWIEKEFAKAWMPELNRLRKSKHKYTRENAEYIIRVTYWLIDKMRNGYGNVKYTAPFWYVDEKTKQWKMQKVPFRWSYFSG